MGNSCNEVGFFYSAARHGFARDDVKARALWRRACELGSKDGCDSWGTGLRDAIGGPSDFEGAAAAYELACKLGDTTGCTNLGSALLIGQGTKLDPERAEALWRQICARDSIGQSCRLLGTALARGRWFRLNVAEGLSLLRRACNLGSAEDCREAGEVMNDVGSHDEAVRYLRTSCTWGSPKGCRALGSALLEKVGDDEAAEEAADVLRRACDAKDDASCRILKREAPAAQP